MKNQNDLCLLKVTYSLLNCDGEGDNKVQETSFEHVVVAHNKEEVLKKIEAFENSLTEKSPASAGSHWWDPYYEYVLRFAKKAGGSYQQLLRI